MPNNQTLTQLPNGLPRGQPSPISDRHALECAQQAVEKALGDGSDRAAEMALPGQSVSQGITIDLSHNNLAGLPDEAVDIINQNIERLALSHNLLSTIPPRLSLCTSLRYLNVRSNSIEEFPRVLFEFKCLEILDLSRNRINALPDDMVKMTSLKVLAAQKNVIKDIPFCVAEMTALLALKVDGNPLNPVIKRIVDAHPRKSGSNGVRDNEGIDIIVTTKIKRFLRHQVSSATARASSESSLESGEEGNVHQHSSKRSRAGRFPIKVYNADEPISRSSPFPPNSYSKASSLHNNALWGFGTVPLALDEREPLQTSSNVHWRPDPQHVRSRKSRPGTIANKRFGVQQVPQLPETDRLSQHLRGRSLSAAMSASAHLGEPKDCPSSLPEELLDIIPIHRSNTYDTLLTMAQAVYLSVHRIHWLVTALSSLANDGSSKRSSLQMVVYNASFHLSELGQQIKSYVFQADQNPKARLNASQIRRACTVLVKAYIPVCSQVCRSIGILVERAEPRYVHDFMSLMYTSVMGLRAEFLRPLQNNHDFGQTIKPRPVPEEPRRTDTGRNRSLGAQTPAPDQSMASRWPPLMPLPPTGEHGPFEQAYVALCRLCELIPEILPAISQRLSTKPGIKGHRSAPRILEPSRSVLNACSKVVDLSESISRNLASVRTKGLDDPFRGLCYRLIDAWATFGDILKSSNSQLDLGPDLMERLQQVQQTVKEVMNCLRAVYPSTNANSASTRPAGSLQPIPLTPQQASLGPAVQATVPFSP
ncbi:hypothetical protein F66182_9210 [Fusarium sp. NRRL 66182]|nr:hypothetical protein F66182_9210 [Fusarium sp. NRRL 66182]